MSIDGAYPSGLAVSNRIICEFLRLFGIEIPVALAPYTTSLPLGEAGNGGDTIRSSSHGGWCSGGHRRYKHRGCQRDYAQQQRPCSKHQQRQRQEEHRRKN